MSNQLAPTNHVCFPPLKRASESYIYSQAPGNSASHPHPDMDGRRIATSYAVIFVTFVLFQEISNSYAQVTFSRDWNAGKRAVSDCSQMSIKSAAAICQMLLGELKSLATCEMRSLLSSRVSEEVDNAPDEFSARTG